MLAISNNAAAAEVSVGKAAKSITFVPKPTINTLVTACCTEMVSLVEVRITAELDVDGTKVVLSIKKFTA